MATKTLSNLQAQHLGVEALGAGEIGNIEAEVVKFEKVHHFLLYHVSIKVGKQGAAQVREKVSIVFSFPSPVVREREPVALGMEDEANCATTRHLTLRRFSE